MWSFRSEALLSLEKPWYLVSNVEDFKISVHYNRKSLQTHPVYFYHLNFLGNIYKKNAGYDIEIKLPVLNGANQYRAESLKKYFVERVGVPVAHIRVGLKREGASGAEDSKSFTLALKKGKRKKEVLFEVEKEKKRSIANQKSNILLTETRGSLEVFQKANSNLEYYLGLALSSFEKENSYQAVGLLWGGGYKINEWVSLAAELDYSFYNNLRNEEVYGLGFDAYFETVRLRTRIYYQKRNILFAVKGQNETYNDYGLFQAVGLKVLKYSKLKVNLMFSLGMSLGNSFKLLNSSHVFTYSSEIEFEVSRKRLSFVIFRESRELKGSQNYNENYDLEGLKARFYF